MRPHGIHMSSAGHRKRRKERVITMSYGGLIGLIRNTLQHSSHLKHATLSSANNASARRGPYRPPAVDRICASK